MKESNKNLITGMLFFRTAVEELPFNDGRKLMMVCGIVAVPQDSHIKPEHQHPVMSMDGFNLTIDTDSIDRTELARGKTPNGILSEPIWRH
jgi:hypothetical protein